jgi:ATP-dependent protease HslVU (ClpYQ) peptidase subunit
VTSGLNVGDTVVAGPYQRIRQLVEGDVIVATDGDVAAAAGN